ncbi:DUF58 domain-containing protein [Paenibacillus sp. OV219]|uniref:DUF58 domain-containing protein n=1 Tax=Paenibacillus sp. OV219 TaxID=1884377 RepID=UPI0008ACAE3A|nr:DUF58 domain-containing protein [Paenibacillus sp. OV219]SEP00619.1 Uncharacterized conserved protein, DUF58 family, contains vWF domain [Paenibacillus sp. OV219]
MTASSRKRLQLRQFLADRFVHQAVLPTGRLIALAAAGAVVAAIVYAIEDAYGLYALVVWNILLLIFTIIDYLLLPRRGVFSLERTVQGQADVRQYFDVQLTLRASRQLLLMVSLTDDLPLAFKQATVHGRIRGDSCELSYVTSSAERGRYPLRHAHLLYGGGLGLIRKYARLSCDSEVRIVPDLSQVRGILGSTPATLILDGQKIVRKTGAGLEFDSIREYVQGDDPRTVNWRAAARANKLMTNVLRPERGKIVTIVIDCGRMMGVELQGQTKLDRVLESALALAAVALKQGDQVALLAFSSKVNVYVPQDKGLAHLNRLTGAVYDVHSEFVESSYSVAFSYLMRVQKKRSFIVLFSDMESYLYHQDIAAYVRKLRRSHMLLLLSLQDPLLHQWAHTPVTNARTGFIQSVAHKFNWDRRQYAETMAQNGIDVLDVRADQLTLSAVNLYLNLKNRDAL